ncbi:VirB8/TrbF family protein [Treponema pectinovorum]|uniref:VirB8/TrbF family protein n=1 Tax=Treponema pectinovorum TaxID=164 RepID=UPI0011F37EF6|nr:VirB8/TrbF family protein [Treponema pectinovorum]
MASSNTKTFFSDGDASPTPFNNLVKKKQSASNSKGYNYEMVAAADTIQGLSQKNARMWQIIALVSLSSFFIALGILIYAVTLPKTVPVIVTVDTNGNATYVGKVDKAYWGKSNIPEHHKTYQVQKLISNMYTWVIDANAQRSYIKECENICQNSALNQLDVFFRNNNPFDWLGVRTQSVKMDLPLKQTSNTYVIYYDVLTYQQGRLLETKRFSALVTLGYFEVTEDTKNLNPLGVYITSFDIQPVN